jgi:hypothetical protein
MKYESSITYHSKDITNVKVFKKWIKLQGQSQEVKIMVSIERTCHHMKFESPIAYHSKVMANVKDRQSNRQAEGPKTIFYINT